MSQKNYVVAVGQEIPPHRVVKFGSSDNTIALCEDEYEPSIGVTGRYKGVAVAGDRVDVHRDGFCLVTFGDAATRGCPLYASTDGKVYSEVTTGQRIIGYAEQSAQPNDIGWMLIAQGYYNPQAS